MFKKSILTISAVFFIVSVLSGCAVNFYRRDPRSERQIEELREQVHTLEAKRMAERDRFAQIKRMLEEQLKGQISRDQVSLAIQEGSLVIVLSDDILFDSGKAEIKKEAYVVLDKLSVILIEELPTKNIGIAGHTDNVPIRFSPWASNWELSTARATSVLHYLVDVGVAPQRLSAIGYGEHRPVASNETSAGRAKNRRVEISILPEFLEKRPGDISEVIK